MAFTSQVVATPDIHGPSYIRPPFFDGTDYAYWRNKMEMFLDSEGVNLWDIIEEGWSSQIKKGELLFTSCVLAYYTTSSLIFEKILIHP